jgi:hypothetical protein
MSFRDYQKGGLAEWLWYAIIVIASRACCEPAIQMVNKQTNFWHNQKGGIVGWFFKAIIVVVLIIILILALRFLFKII